MTGLAGTAASQVAAWRGMPATERSAISSVECSPALVPAHHRDGTRVTSFAHMPKLRALSWRISGSAAAIRPLTCW